MKRLILLITLAFVAVSPSFSQPVDDYQILWQCSGASATSEFGAYLVSAGDQNQDGFDDILITASQERKVYLYYGGSPMDTIPDLVFGPPESHVNLPKECRDLNGDGYPDIAIGGGFTLAQQAAVFIYYGGPQLDNQYDLVFTPDTLLIATNYGHFISMGDINGDGWYDLVVGDDSYQPNLVDYGIGKIFVYYGGPDIDTQVDFSITGYYNNLSSIGEYLSCGGDVNGDGFDDIMTRGRYPGDTDGAIIFFGGAPPDSTPDWCVTISGTFISGDINIIPDINDDSYDEFVLGGYSGISYLRYGAEIINQPVDVNLNGVGDYTSHCRTAGDVNNDGFYDFISGTWENGGEYVNIFTLNNHLSNWEIQDWYTSQPKMISAVGYAGDINGDGIDDFMFSTSTILIWDEGEIFIYSDTTLSSVETPEKCPVVSHMILYNNYPNPFNAETTIEYNLKWNSDVSISIYNVLGQEVVKLVDGLQNMGVQKIRWDGRNSCGTPVTSGIYFFKIHAKSSEQHFGRFEAFDKTMKMTMVK